MIRWTYVIPRGVIASLLLLTLLMGVGPALRWSLIQSVQTATGAKVEIESLRMDWLAGSATLNQIEVAHPNRPFQNLVQASRAELDFDVPALLRKEWVVENATLQNVEFGQPRVNSGQLPKAAIRSTDEPPVVDWLDPAKKRASNQLKDWLSKLGDLGTETLTREFQTAQVTAELSTKWPKEYEDLRSRFDLVNSQYEELKLLATRPKGNPLRMVEMVSSARRNVELSLTEIDAIYTDLKRLRQQIPIDKQRLLDAKAHDEECIRAWAKSPKISGEDITQSLFGDEYGTQIHETLNWIQWIRQVIPDLDEDFRPDRARGIDVRFSPQDLTPTFWIKSADITGGAPFGKSGSSLPFQGTIKNLSTHPRRVKAPTSIDLSTSGEQPIFVQAELLRTGNSNQDRISIHAPSLLQKAQSFGETSSVVMAFPEGRASVEIDATINDGHLKGAIRLVRSPFPIIFEHVAPKLGGSYTLAMMGHATDAIDRSEVVIRLEGPVRSPKLTLDSTVGPQLAAAFNDVADQIIADQTQRLREGIDDEIGATLSQANRFLDDVAAFQQTLQTIDTEISTIKQNVAKYLTNGLLR